MVIINTIRLFKSAGVCFALAKIRTAERIFYKILYKYLTKHFLLYIIEGRRGAEIYESKHKAD
jgi:hypothetical protein